MKKIPVEGMNSTYMILTGDVKERMVVDVGGFKVLLRLIDNWWIATYKPAKIIGYARTKEGAIRAFGKVLSASLLYQLEQQNKQA